MVQRGQTQEDPNHRQNELVIEFVAACLEALDELPAQDREGRTDQLIEEICREHPEETSAVKERVEALLHAGLVTREGSGGPQLRSLDRYRLVGELGRGGMGVVYLAFDPRLGRLVALKALGSRMIASDVARARFKREIKAIAGLKHPRIVPIYEVGEADGLPYFTMEYVEGRTMADIVGRLRDLEIPSGELKATHLGMASFLAETRQDLEQPQPTEAQSPPRSAPPELPMEWGKTYVETVCRLVHDVAEALQHAHEHGIVHRDIKPSNIFVAADGRALLFDFGLARIELEETVTLTGDFAGTPYYVAPEQISAQSHGVDGRSDVYALGVTLYELLTLRRPFEGSNAQAIFRQVLSREAPLPRRFNRLIPRDLETICVTALEKSPEHRYQSAADLAADLRRFLEFRPVQARPIGWVRRGMRLARRHPGASIAVALGGLILLGFPLGLGLYNLRISAEAERARQAETLAQREAERAQAVNAFLVGVISSADPAVAGAPEVSVRELLDLSAAQVDDRFPGRPDIEAAVRRVVGNSYLALGRYDEALPHLEAALQLRRAEQPLDAGVVAQSVYDLGALRFKQRDLASAEEHFREALEMRRAVYREDHEDLAQSLMGLAALLAESDRLEQSRTFGEASLAMRRRVHGDQHPAVVNALLGLGKIALWSDDMHGAETYFQEALDTALELFGPRDLTVATVQAHLGALRRMRGSFDDARELWEEALATRIELLGEDHLSTAEVMINLARVARILSEPEKSKQLAESGLAILEATLGPEHESLANGLENLGLALVALDEFEEAGRVMERALAILRATHGEIHTNVAACLFDIGALHGEAGDPGQAAVAYESALEIVRQTRDPDSRMVAVAYMLLGQTQEQLGDLEQAEMNLREALRIFVLHYSEGAPNIVMTEDSLGVVLARSERFEEAIPLLERAFAVYNNMQHGMIWPILTSGRWLGESLAGAGRTTDAEKHLLGLIDFADGAQPEGSAENADVLAVYGDLLLGLERPGEARGPLERAVEMGVRVAPDARQAHAEARANLALALSRTGEHEAAQDHALSAYRTLVELGGVRHDSAREALAGIIELYDAWGREGEAARWRAQVPSPD